MQGFIKSILFVLILFLVIGCAGNKDSMERATVVSFGIEDDKRCQESVDIGVDPVVRCIVSYPEGTVVWCPCSMLGNK